MAASDMDAESPAVTSPAKKPRHAVDESKRNVTLNACLRPTSTATHEDVREQILAWLRRDSVTLRPSGGFLVLPTGVDILEHIDNVTVNYDEKLPGDDADPIYGHEDLNLAVNVFQLNEDGAGEEMDGEDDIATYKEWVLPSRDFHGMWESLVYGDDVKLRLTKYAGNALLFSQRGVDPNLIAWNRVVLLHGPPGTGKTTLCKALAQQLAIRFQDTYPTAVLVEVNAHSLFSRWFSESGKLVSRLFQKIQDLLDDEGSLVFVLIDEVESLAAARKAAASGAEPSDAIRVVNALLTQVDGLKHRPNAMVLTTSNITEAIDLAFVDRADIKAYVGPPGFEARCAIIASAVNELIAKGLVQFADDEAAELPTIQALRERAKEHGFDDLEAWGRWSIQEVVSHQNAVGWNPDGSCKQPFRFDDARFGYAYTLAETEGFSGRALRKLPFLGYALAHTNGRCSLFQFIKGFDRAIEQEVLDRSSLEKTS
jgi:energy-coupling factor transporter ATP-binding protein EcfA2